MKANRLPYSKNTGYRVPQGYFDGLEARILARVAEAPSEGLPEKATVPFRVPDAYFESLEGKLMAKIAPPRKRGKLVSLLQRESFYYAAGVAAVFVAIVTNAFFAQPDPITMETLDMVTLENYLQESVGNPSLEMSQLFSEELYSYAPIGRPELNQEAVMEYLQENLEDPSVILNAD